MQIQHIRLITDTVIDSPAYHLLIKRQIGETLTIETNVSREQAEELLASGNAVNAYGTPARWD